jgi:hypothetical protein
MPGGRLQSEIVEMVITGRGKVGNAEVLIGHILMKGLAYRSPDDLFPGTGFSYMVMPGGTPFTRGSEVENCETSAWGRAIAALGIEVRRGIASADEVRNKEQDGEAVVNITPSNEPQPARGGHQAQATREQVINVIELSKHLDYNASDISLLIDGALDLPAAEFPEDEDEAKDFVKRRLVALSADEIGLVIVALLKVADEAGIFADSKEEEQPILQESLSLEDKGYGT